MLTYCQVLSICEYLQIPGSNCNFNWNGGMCSSVSQVLAACTWIGTDELVGDPGLTVFPNPSTGELALHFSLPEPGNLRIEIFNPLGELVRRFTGEAFQQGIQTVDLQTGLADPGLYHIRITCGTLSLSGKFILAR